jgi:hypothetical protein
MKKKQIHGLGLVEAVSLALVIVLIGAVSYLVFISDEAFKSSPQEVEAQPPMPAIPPYSDEQTLTEEEKSEAIELAINDPEVKKWLDEGYEIYGAISLSAENESGGMCMVYVLTQKQKLPWALGITLGVPVDLVRKEAQGGCINFDMKLASLTENQKEEVLRIALADPEVLEMIGDKEYEIQDVRVEYWERSHKGKSSFHAYPAVSMNVNPDPKLTGIFAIVYVDLENGAVIKIFTNPRKSLPPSDGQSTKIEPTKEVPTMMDIPHLNLTPQPGEYFTYRGNKSKILLNDSRLKYCFLELKDICPPNAANVGDPGIVITGTIKNEYGSDYWICMAAHAFNLGGEQIGYSIDPGPVCGIIAPYVKSDQTGNFELHLKYREDIERIELFVGCVSEIPPP